MLTIFRGARGSPFAKIEASVAIYFPDMLDDVVALDALAITYQALMTQAGQRRLANEANFTSGFLDVFNPFWEARGKVMTQLRAKAKELPA